MNNEKFLCNLYAITPYITIRLPLVTMVDGSVVSKLRKLTRNEVREGMPTCGCL